VPAENAVEEKSRRRRKKRSVESEIEAVAEEEIEDDEERGVTERKGRATPGRRNRPDGEDDGNFITRPINSISNYFNGVRDELAKVTWPDREELLRLSWIVLAATIASALVLGTISYIFTELFRIGLSGNEWLFIIPIAFVASVLLGYSRWATKSDDFPRY
jgi:preprotein translocase SecE subunit